MQKLLKPWTTTPKVGDVIDLLIGGETVKLKVVPRTTSSCDKCYLYGKIENSKNFSSECFNFEGNKQCIWMNCGKKYRSDKTDIMFIKKSECV